MKSVAIGNFVVNVGSKIISRLVSQLSRPLIKASVTFEALKSYLITELVADPKPLPPPLTTEYLKSYFVSTIEKKKRGLEIWVVVGLERIILKSCRGKKRKRGKREDSIHLEGAHGRPPDIVLLL